MADPHAPVTAPLPPGLARLLRDGELFEPGPVAPRVARAPGRLDVLGGIADYSGARVLELPLRESAWVAVGPRHDRRLRVRSAGRAELVELDAGAFAEAAAAGLPACRELLAGTSADRWPAYVLGPIAALAAEGCALPAGGLGVALCSDVPEGAGVSSSAAVEVAAATAFAGFAGVAVEPLRLALACQRAENEVAGAPCGAMDQVTSACGRAGALLDLLCQPATLLGAHALPPGFWCVGIDSGVRHAVAGDPYGDARAAAFMGLRILESLAGPPPGGYLANVPRDAFERLRERLPERMRGAEFLARYGGIADRVARVRSERSYPVRAAAAHGLEEHARVAEFAELLPRLAEPGVAARAGELLLASHRGYGSCGLGSDATDALVERACAAGPVRGVFGARITGGGSGGTVCLLVDSRGLTTARRIADEHAAATGAGGRLFVDSGPGAELHHGVAEGPP
ncbi:MAG: GHMP kinase [Planctomycetes bacterium]|nr:GHMP kinase [Planctomycetota bacterium]